MKHPICFKESDFVAIIFEKKISNCNRMSSGRKEVSCSVKSYERKLISDWLETRFTIV